MSASFTPTPPLPSYQGRNWLAAKLPDTACNWLDNAPGNWQLVGPAQPALTDQLLRLADPVAWQWPEQLVVFITDLHADAEALSASLVASGLFARHGPAPGDLTPVCHMPAFEIIIGGDCLDKGPANLPLLRLIRQLIDWQIPLTLLSGNHDLRLQLAIQSLKQPDCSRNGHFLLRLGSKIMPFCVELLSEYPLSTEELQKLPTEAECRQILLPSEDWPDRFRQAATSHLSPAQINLELERLEARKQRFFQAATTASLTLQQIYAALQRWQQQFMEPDGEFYWFTERQQLLCRRGSFVFVHAGCDDSMAQRLAREDWQTLNSDFQVARQGEAFSLYFGPLGNMLRTKYRRQDPPLTASSRQALHQAGIHALVHGHRNLHQGQRITFRANMIHFECDVTLNQVSRQQETLQGSGAAVTLFYPQGWVVGISSDAPAAKCFSPQGLHKLATQLYTDSTK
ncbi:metallophosphoesterase [Nitrincola sp.]|uniref:metallophosphoesterase n=1 Tax=Nitrincola sp. TaxID=1926584 RepID=UPI003A95384C